jgi:diguanylate cyclase (GGDEF)-like protein
VVLPDTPASGAVVVAENLRAAVEQAGLPHTHSKVSNRVTLSLGVGTVLPEEGLAPKDLIELADKALYEAKAEGRNRVASMVGALPPAKAS